MEGSGKTSLVGSIVQICEDIVHVDPYSTSTSPTRSALSVSEIYASTKPYPAWWSDLEDSRVLRRRKSSGDVVLERNLCFVDTSGGGRGAADQTVAIVHYIHQQLRRNTSALNDAGNVDFQNLLAGNGGSQVDAILYLISQRMLSTPQFFLLYSLADGCRRYTGNRR